MSKDGKKLEALVATVEEILVPSGFSVTRGETRYFDSGKQEVEFDVIVSGKVGSGDIKWLIECRDRPSAGAAPGSWIEQLDGRRRLYGFSKVSSVSTTGFSESALNAGRKLDIDLRTVSDLDPAALTSWLQMDAFTVFNRLSKPTFTKVLLSDEEPQENKEAASTFLAQHKSDALILRSTKSGEMHSASGVMQAALSDQDLYQRAKPDGRETSLKLMLEYPNNDDHYVLDLPDGPLRVRALYYELTLKVETIKVPLASSVSYKAEGADKPIAEVASFGPLPFGEGNQFFELHRLADATHIVLRKTK